MRYDIEGFITFDTEDASLLNLLTGDCVELSQTSTRLLAELLNHRGDILSRSEIFHSVFDQYGARASNSNLNQYISTLRRNLSDLGVEKEIITTVPRIGFKIADDVVIHNDREYRTPFLEEKVPDPTRNPPSPSFFERIARIMTLGFVLILLLIRPHNVDSGEDIHKIVDDQCIIFTSPALTLWDVKNSFNFTTQPFDCSQPKELYLYKKQIKGALGNIIHLLLIECNNGYCESFYYREKTNV